MKKNKSLLIALNLLILIILLFVADVFVAYKDYRFMCGYINEVSSKFGPSDDENILPPFEYRFGLIPFKTFWKKESRNFEKDINRNAKSQDEINTKKSILIFGDSFAEGSNPDVKDNLTYVLNQYTNRTTYNRAFGGFGPAPMLWQARNKMFYNGIKTPPEYVIYMFVTYQPDRIINDKWGNASSRPIYVGYNDKDGKLIENKSPLLILCNLNFIKKFVLEYYNKKVDLENANRQNYLFNLFKLHLVESKKAIQEKYPDTKFIIIKYPMVQDPSDENKRIFYETPLWEEFKKEGFIIYDLKEKIDVDLTNPEYLLPDLHPNAKAWNTVVPKLAKDFNL